MQIEVTSLGSIKVLLIPSQVDDAIALKIENTLTRLINEGHLKIMCDFSKTDSISKAGLQVFITILKQLHSLHGQISFCMLKPAIREQFTSVGLTHIYKFYDIEESLQINVLKELSAYFDDYADIHGIKLRRTTDVLYIEIYLEFEGKQPMYKVQQNIDKIKGNLEGKIKGSQVLIIPTTMPPPHNEQEKE